MKTKMNCERICSSFESFHSLLSELQTHILLTFLREENLRYEFPKLFCVCKEWITEHLESPVARQLYEATEERWYSNIVESNLRMFAASIFPTVEFVDHRVKNAAPVGLLHSGAIVKELGRIETSNGAYCVTANGCSRYKNESGEVYLAPVDLRTLGHIYSPKGDCSIPLYFRGFDGRVLTYEKFYKNVHHPNNIFEDRDYDFFQILLPDHAYELYLKRSDIEKKELYYFTLPSSRKNYTFVDMRRREVEVVDVPLAGPGDVERAESLEIDV